MAANGSVFVQSPAGAGKFAYVRKEIDSEMWYKLREVWCSFLDYIYRVMLTTTQNRHKLILDAYDELKIELAVTGRQNKYGNYYMADIVAERIGRIYESEYVYNVIFRPHIFEAQDVKKEQLELF